MTHSIPEPSDRCKRSDSIWLVYAKHEGLCDSAGREMPVAKTDSLKEALHYSRIYGQDGPTRVVEKIVRMRRK